MSPISSQVILSSKGLGDLEDVSQFSSFVILFIECLSFGDRLYLRPCHLCLDKWILSLSLQIRNAWTNSSPYTDNHILFSTSLFLLILYIYKVLHGFSRELLYPLFHLVLKITHRGRHTGNISILWEGKQAQKVSDLPTSELYYPRVQNYWLQFELLTTMSHCFW